jgi:hypothetical protein
MRRWLFLLGLFAVPPALAQELPVETVVSDASAMAGLWRISRPDVISVAEKAPPLLGPLRESFCRIEAQPDGVAMHCSGLEAARVTAEGPSVQFAWGSAAARLAIIGELESPHYFRGRFRIHLSGAAYDNPAVSEAVRVTPEPGAPDGGGKADLLRRILAHGFAGVRRDESRRWAEPPKLGAITAITYVGQEAGDAQPDLFSTYWVAFAQGERICKLRQRADGALDGFACV